MRNEASQHWRLKGRSVHVTTYTSGQVCEARIRIRWSEKLGLELKHVCVDHAQAERVANAIRAKGVVCVDNWHMRYFPGKQWETRCHAD